MKLKEWVVKMSECKLVRMRGWGNGDVFMATPRFSRLCPDTSAATVGVENGADALGT